MTRVFSILFFVCFSYILLANEISFVSSKKQVNNLEKEDSTRHLTVSNIKEQVNILVKEEATRELTVSNCKPDGRITKLMEKIDEIGHRLMSLETQSDDAMGLSEKCLAVLSALRERRIYAYMLWAEGRLEEVNQGRYADLRSLSQHELMKLYEYLSDINISIIRENMLNREIMARLAEIYDCLDNSNKPLVRINAIKQQRDPLSINIDKPIRKSLDDF